MVGWCGFTDCHHRNADSEVGAGVISSGHISDELREPARSAGVRRPMHKQNTLEELAGLIREVLSMP